MPNCVLWYGTKHYVFQITKCEIELNHCVGLSLAYSYTT